MEQNNKVSELEQRLLDKKVKEHVVNRYGLLLVPAGSVVDRSALDLMWQHGIPLHEVKVFPVATESSSSDIKVLEESASYLQSLFEKTRIEQKVPILEVKNEILPVVQEVARHPRLFELFEAVKAKDEYTHQHNIGVGVLATLLGNWLNLPPAEMTLLSLAATLHDVGKVNVSSEILQKPGKLTAAEYEEIKRHTVFGYELLRDSAGTHPRISLVALQHHERADGSGYPLQMKHSQVEPYSRIVAVADVFHAISSNRPYHDAMPFYEVVTKLRQCAYGQLDPHYVSVFIRNMTRHLLGQQVVLTDGRMGEVVFVNSQNEKTHEIKPLLKIGQTFVDLDKEPHLQIDKVIA
jgi:HD-GYP domain-containing protein (c-di-GMP phosphodiesterase class II)